VQIPKWLIKHLNDLDKAYPDRATSPMYGTKRTYRELRWRFFCTHILGMTTKEAEEVVRKHGSTPLPRDLMFWLAEKEYNRIER
jgi:hypothetical protein